MIHTKQMALAATVTTAVLWTICSAMVAAMPNAMLQLTAHMVHVDVTGFTWTLTWTGFFIGLLGWSVSAGAAGFVLAITYNRFSRSAHVAER